MLEEAKKVFCSVVAGFPLSARCVRLQCPRAQVGKTNEALALLEQITAMSFQPSNLTGQVISFRRGTINLL